MKCYEREIIVHYTKHFIKRFSERTPFKEVSDIENFLNECTNGIIYTPLRKKRLEKFSYLGISWVNAKIPLKKIEENKLDNNYIGLTFLKGYVCSKYSHPCTIKWVHSEDTKFLNESVKWN